MKFCLVILSIFFFILIPKVSLAQEDQDTSNTSLAIANFKPITDPNAKEGDIISSSDKGYILSKIPYDPNMSGIITQKAAIVLNEEASSGAQPVVSNGTAVVNVTTSNGAIVKGDLITTSETAGAGMKATKSGYVLGTALEGFDCGQITPGESEPTPGVMRGCQGQVALSINIHFNRSKASSNTAGSLKDIFSLSVLAATESPIMVFKYVMAGLVIVASIGAGLFMFGKTANRGLEALGRNPMAQKIIEMGMLINVVLAVVVVVSGVFIASLILKF